MVKIKGDEIKATELTQTLGNRKTTDICKYNMDKNIENQTNGKNKRYQRQLRLGIEKTPHFTVIDSVMHKIVKVAELRRQEECVWDGVQSVNDSIMKSKHPASLL